MDLSLQVMGYSAETPEPSGAGTIDIHSTPTPSQTVSHPADKLATQAGNSSTKKIVRSDFKAPHVDSNMHLQDDSRAPEEHSSTPHKEAAQRHTSSHKGQHLRLHGS